MDRTVSGRPVAASGSEWNREKRHSRVPFRTGPMRFDLRPSAARALAQARAERKNLFAGGGVGWGSSGWRVQPFFAACRGLPVLRVDQFSRFDAWGGMPVLRVDQFSRFDACGGMP